MHELYYVEEHTTIVIRMMMMMMMTMGMVIKTMKCLGLANYLLMDSVQDLEPRMGSCPIGQKGGLHLTPIIPQS